jgi:monoterpene epsilon-lactone hydrolase
MFLSWGWGAASHGLRRFQQGRAAPARQQRRLRKGIAFLASLTARLFQSCLKMALARQMPRDEPGLLKARRNGGGPSASMRRRFIVETQDMAGRLIVTVRPKLRPVRGYALYFHGGGYANGPAFLHWRFVAHLVKTFDLECTVPLYPLAPEHRCDAGVAFASDAYRAVLAERGPDRLIVLGDSAGGGLALATIQHTSVVPAGLILNAPWLDASVSDPTQPEIERSDWLLNRFILRTWAKWWAGSRYLEDPMVSPLFGDLLRLPKTLMFAGSADILVADARRLVNAAPAKVRYVEETGLMHVYPLFGFLPETRRAWREIGVFVDAVLPPESPLCG